jgi:LysR family hydrogen peroxide-inducible transcriptional activator
VNLKDLKYLVALADTGHFGRAAERTFVSQPTLSAQLKKLEDYLGVKLVERQPRNVQLTEVGRQVVVCARRMLDDGEQIIALARDNKDPFAGRLKVALIPTIGPYLLPRVMQKIRKALPQIALMLYEHQTEALLKRLRDGEVDLGIMALPVAPDGLETRALYEEAFTVALPNRHPLAARSMIKVQDLKGETLLLLEDGHCLRDQALEVCSRIDVRGGVAVRLATRPHDPAVREAGADAHRGGGVAQIEHPRPGHHRGMRHPCRGDAAESMTSRTRYQV